MSSNKEFEKFKSGLSGATRNAPSLGAALASPSAAKATAKPAAANAQSRKKQVSFYLDQSILERLGILKAKTQRSFCEFYEEALLALLEKYGE